VSLKGPLGSHDLGPAVTNKQKKNKETKKFFNYCKLASDGLLLVIQCNNCRIFQFFRMTPTSLGVAHR